LARRGTSGGGSSGKFFGCGRVVTGIGIILNRLEEITSAAMKSLRGARQWNFSVSQNDANILVVVIVTGFVEPTEASRRSALMVSLGALVGTKGGVSLIS
jgi:hypothetical protein